MGGASFLLAAVKRGPHQFDDSCVVAANVPFTYLAIRRVVVGAVGIDSVLPVVDCGNSRLPIVVVVVVEVVEVVESMFTFTELELELEPDDPTGIGWVRRRQAFCIERRPEGVFQVVVADVFEVSTQTGAVGADVGVVVVRLHGPDTEPFDFG